MRSPPDGNAKPSGIREVAKEAGVSIATVSRALNRPESVSEELRARIEGAARALRYVPDAAARALTSRRSMTIGAVIPTIDNAMFARGVEALERHLSARGYLLLLATSGYDPEVEQRQAQNIISRGVDGLILRGDVHTAELRDLLASQRVPFINVGVYHPARPHPSVGVDNERAGWLACRHLLDLGHARIGVIAAQTRNNDRASARVNGVRRALSERGLSLDPRWTIEVPYRLDDARQGARTLLANADRPTALVCGNDVIAYGAMLEALRRGVSVPKSLSVIGFDDLEWSRHLHPSLTTVRLPIDEIWTRAGEYLVNALNGRAPAPHHEVDASLIVRESTAPPAHA